MSVCKTLVRTSISSLEHQIRRKKPTSPSVSHQSYRFFSNSSSNLCFASSFSPKQGSGSNSSKVSSRTYGCVAREISNETVSKDLILEEEPEDFSKDRIEELLTSKENDIKRLMKMERRLTIDMNSGDSHWFPYLDMFEAGYSSLTSSEILKAVDPLILDVRKEKMKNVVQNRSYSVCLVVEGLTDYGNVSATCRSADALGFQSIHVVSCDKSKRYRDNRHVSMGAEKWLDIELWNSTQECFKVLKSRGYRIATTHVGMDAVSIYDMDWSIPTAIVVGNESRGISQEALELSDMHCSIPMKGMVDSFNVSVAAGILMHQAVCDRTSRLGCHGDLTSKESQILLAEFSLRHSRSAICIAYEHAKRKANIPVAKL
ncbi:tRNA (guanosine(18)-2'-O)-methyltransferase [Thalictrum thalictroides]|uniref:tRNA (Guanosine(18)-2'-O)-methyltransferase n=1 Tax=Thalictrum thalictroides TaxID=46969 RepID=A0A7J6V8R4_THATH|nr:tRNA (guanosine(18)-2'-O)-methyltransferase [Thalictrum thalictroides]